MVEKLGDLQIESKPLLDSLKVAASGQGNDTSENFGELEVNNE